MKIITVLLNGAVGYLAVGAVISVAQLGIARGFDPDCKGTVEHTLWEDYRPVDASTALRERATGQRTSESSPYVFRLARGAARWLPDLYTEVLRGNMTLGNYMRGGYRCLESPPLGADVLNSLGFSVGQSITQIMSRASGQPAADAKPGSRATDLVRNSAKPAPATPPMTTFTSAEGRFSIMMPGEPSRKVTDVGTHGDALKAYSYWIEIPPGDVVFMVVYNDFPVAPGGDLTALWEKIRSGAGEGVQVARPEDIQVSGRPAHRFELTSSSTRLLVTDVFDGVRLYQVIFETPLNAPIPPEADQFVRSFRILEEGRALRYLRI